MIVAAVFLPAAALGQTKGIVVDNGSKSARLPPPQLTVSDLGDGCVRLTWTPVPGARYYALGRALGTNGLQRIEGGRDGSTEYRDRIAGTRVPVVYRVTAIDAQDVAGVPGTSERIFVTGGKAAGCPVSRRGPTQVTAFVRGERILVDWRLPGGVGSEMAGQVAGRIPGSKEGAEVRHWVDGHPQPPERVSAASGTVTAFPAQPGEHRFEVLLSDADGNLSDPTASNTIVIQGKEAGSGAATSPVGAAAAANAGALAAGAELSFAVRASTSLRPGGTTSVNAGVGAEWTSLDPAVATVTPQGQVTARTAGEARVVGVSAAGSGGVRVTVVRVVVTP